MGDQFVLAALAAIATIAVAVIGSVGQRDSRRSALQEVELLAKLDPESEAADSLRSVLLGRIRTWTGAPAQKLFLLSLGVTWFGWAVLAWGTGSDPRATAPYVGGIIWAGGMVLLVYSVRQFARELWQGFQAKRLIRKLTKWAASEGLSIPEAVLNPPNTEFIQLAKVPTPEPKEPAPTPKELAPEPTPPDRPRDLSNRGHHHVPPLAAAAVAGLAAAVVVWKVRRRHN